MKNIRKHIIICAALFLISAALEWIVYLHYDSLTVRPIILNSRMAIAPVYNTDGSWLHGRLGIGYNGPLLWLENITALFAVWYLFRMMEGHNAFFGVSQNWLYA
ncbi:MAG: hypothetical protein K2N43_09305, partial [Lachnospiraceae bacterium]|nr:hypothetical protein [Lachnospiraceae bacterium]